MGTKTGRTRRKRPAEGLRVTEPPAVAAEAWLAFLGDPASYPHRPGRVDVMQTHASYVALAPPAVYKVKKPVNFGFLDFSTLARRRYFCEQEVRLNRRLCPDTYRGVVPISRVGGRLAFGRGGDVVEYAVHMRYLPHGGFMHERLARGAVHRADLDRVVATLAAFYRAETSTAAQAAWGRPDNLRISTDENFEQTAACVGDLLTKPAYEALRYYTARFFDQHARRLHRRRAGGYILDCHGDLRLEHIHLTPEKVSIFDCIEFNDRLRYIDVANDVAFLAMDLDFHGRSDLAAYVVARMGERLDDPDLVGLVDFYKVYRAYVRAKVESLRSREPEVPGTERRASRDRARRYYRLALRVAVAGSSPLAVVVMGGVGTGKSTVAVALADALGWDVLSSDRMRKAQAGVPSTVRADAEARAALYARERTDAVYAALRDGALARAEGAKGVVLDATFSRRRHRDALRRALAGSGIPYAFIELTAGRETVEARLRRRALDPAAVSDARLEDLDALEERYEAPDDLEDARHAVFPTDTTLDDTVLAILKHLVRMT